MSLKLPTSLTWFCYTLWPQWEDKDTKHMVQHMSLSSVALHRLHAENERKPDVTWPPLATEVCESVNERMVCRLGGLKLSRLSQVLYAVRLVLPAAIARNRCPDGQQLITPTQSLKPGLPAQRSASAPRPKGPGETAAPLQPVTSEQGGHDTATRPASEVKTTIRLHAGRQHGHEKGKEGRKAHPHCPIVVAGNVPGSCVRASRKDHALQCGRYSVTSLHSLYMCIYWYICPNIFVYIGIYATLYNDIQ